MRTATVISTIVSPAGFFPRTVNARCSISLTGLPVVASMLKPSGSGVLLCMKNSVMMFLYTGLPLLTSVFSTNSMLLLSYWMASGSRYSHFSFFTSPSTPFAHSRYA